MLSLLIYLLTNTCQAEKPLYYRVKQDSHLNLREESKTLELYHEKLLDVSLVLPPDAMIAVPPEQVAQAKKYFITLNRFSIEESDEGFVKGARIVYLPEKSSSEILEIEREKTFYVSLEALKLKTEAVESPPPLVPSDDPEWAWVKDIAVLERSEEENPLMGVNPIENKTIDDYQNRLDDVAELIEQEISLVTKTGGQCSLDPKKLSFLEKALDRRNHRLSLVNDDLYEGYLKEIPSGVPLSEKTNGLFSSGFGARKNPITKKREFHPGADYAVPIGTPILATAEGEVLFSGKRGGYGGLVIVKHSKTGLETWFGHTSKNLVKVGDQIKIGDPVALSGNTGMSSGPHVHYEVRINHQVVDPLITIK